MPKGTKKIFKIRLSLSTREKKTWKLLMDEAKCVHKEVHRMMGESHSAIDKEELLLGKTFKVEAPNLLDFTAQISARDAFANARARRGFLRQYPSIYPLYVPNDSVVFADSDTVVRVPYLGQVEYSLNHHFSIFSHSEKQAETRKNVKTTCLKIINNDYSLIIDCSD